MDEPTRRRTLRSMIVIAALLAVALVLSLTTDEKSEPPRAVPVEEVPAPAAVAVDGKDKDALPGDAVVRLDEEAQEIVQEAAISPEEFDLAGDLRGADKGPVAKHEGPLATPNFPGCATRILPTNWSNRTAAVRAIGLHYTAGPNRPGLSDMNGLTGYASSPAAGVSWHFLIDAEGNCYYSVPLGKKAWTIGNLNSQTVNIECVGTGREAVYCNPAKLAAVVRRIGQVFGVPMQLGAVSNCRVTRPGIITHWQGGACSGGHIDIRPFSIENVVRGIQRGAVRPLPGVYTLACKGLAKLTRSKLRRRAAHRSPELTKGQHEQRSALRRRFEPPESRHVRCNERTGAAVRS